MESLQEEEESEDCRYSEGGCEEPTALTEGIDKENANEDSNRTRESNSIVGTDTNQASKFKLSKHETNESKGSVERHKSPESPKLEPPDEIPLRFRTP
jgi:hypothetical protein